MCINYGSCSTLILLGGDTLWPFQCYSKWVECSYSRWVSPSLRLDSTYNVKTIIFCRHSSCSILAWCSWLLPWQRCLPCYLSSRSITSSLSQPIRPLTNVTRGPTSEKQGLNLRRTSTTRDSFKTSRNPYSLIITSENHQNYTSHERNDSICSCQIVFQCCDLICLKRALKLCCTLFFSQMLQDKCTIMTKRSNFW